MTKFELLDRLGRPLLRLVGVFTLFCIGLGVSWAFLAWGVGGREFPSIPGEAILIPLVTQVPQVVDQITRYLQRRQEIAVAPRSI